MTAYGDLIIGWRSGAPPPPDETLSVPILALFAVLAVVLIIVCWEGKK